MLSCAGADLAELEAWSDSTDLFDPKKQQHQLSRVKINDLRGNKNYFELAGGSSYRGFELPIIIDTYIVRYPLIV